MNVKRESHEALAKFRAWQDAMVVAEHEIDKFDLRERSNLSFFTSFMAMFGATIGYYLISPGHEEFSIEASVFVIIYSFLTAVGFNFWVLGSMGNLDTPRARRFVKNAYKEVRSAFREYALTSLNGRVDDFSVRWSYRDRTRIGVVIYGHEIRAVPIGDKCRWTTSFDLGDGSKVLYADSIGALIEKLVATNAEFWSGLQNSRQYKVGG